MNGQQVYLKPNIVIEPLIDKWYAWSHLISPATAAMNITGRHLKIIDSFLTAPDVHEEAVKNPKLLGGPFMDIPGERAAEVLQLREETVKKRKQMIEFSNAVKELDQLLWSEAKGFGIETLYQKVPDILKGYVELFYDRSGNPSFRFFESLLYNSPFYDKTAQSLALWETNNDHRPFCLSTPRLDVPHVLQLDISFDHPGIDALARMKREPGSLEEITRLLGVPKEQAPLFHSFFTETPHRSYDRYTGDKVRMRYFGHACILIETKDLCILADPLISYYGYHSDVEHFSDADLPDVIDYVIITHNHQDHILFETLLPLRHKIKNIIVPRSKEGRLEDPDLKLMFNTVGFHNIIELGEMETIQFPDASITGIPFTGEHSDMNIICKLCHLVQIGEFRLLFMADSRIMEPSLYRHIQRRTGDVDIIFLGMECDGAPLSWLYGPLLTRKVPRDQDNSRRLSGSDCERGMYLVDIFHPREVYVYAMGQEPWIEFITSTKYTSESNPIVESDKLVQLCRDRGIVAERLYGEKELLYEREMVF
ncbi:MBL fold metallo-hydrolase [Chitinophaga sp. G-6-1-13]|uniref:MBL fold metallo-hydrolase n=1 Tax=Chitinophaga fulva TaxID=2728842 RepID=A0A848GKJ9_9BACT|nr:MBL fold metallo-hydrolase [Chitinophaga fulva]NML39135.1 MBL fold metallo-hydrolase [Chitinophaga fulva]